MPEDSYYVRVYLDGVPIPLASHCNDDDAQGSNCRFQVKPLDSHCLAPGHINLHICTFTQIVEETYQLYILQ